MKLEYKCKFCRKPGEVVADPDGFKFIKPEIWLPKIACRRCADYHYERIRIEDVIFKASRIIQMCRSSMDFEKRNALESKTKDRIESLTKKYCTLVCEYWRVTNTWDEDFCQMIFEKPEKAGSFMNTYVRGIAQLSTT